MIKVSAASIAVINVLFQVGNKTLMSLIWIKVNVGLANRINGQIWGIQFFNTHGFIICICVLFKLLGLRERPLHLIKDFFGVKLMWVGVIRNKFFVSLVKYKDCYLHFTKDRKLDGLFENSFLSFAKCDMSLEGVRDEAHYFYFLFAHM